MEPKNWSPNISYIQYAAEYNLMITKKGARAVFLARRARRSAMARANMLGGIAAIRQAQKLLGEYWIARHPRPKEAGFDDGGELKAEFLDLCSNMGLKKKPSSSWNPQSNATLERARQAFGGMLRALELGGAALGENEPLQKFLTGTAYAARSTFLAAQGAAPAQAALGRDMALPAGASIDWDEITRRKQKRINESCERENRRRIGHTYQKGGKVLAKVPKKILRKLEKPRRGPFTVIEHHDNGTVTIQKSPCVTDNINVRRLDPFFE